MYKTLLQLSNIFEKLAITRWKEEENPRKVLEEARKRNLIINSNDFKNVYDKLKSFKNVYLQFNEIIGPLINPKMTHNYRGLYGWKIYNQNLDDILKVVFGAFKKRKYITFFKPKDFNTILISDSYTEEKLKNDLNKIKQIYPQLSGKIDEIYNSLIGEHPFNKLEIILEDALKIIDLPKISRD
jgi:hypothetical protein